MATDLKLKAWARRVARGRRHHGFTLIEVMVTMVIMSVVAAVVVGAFHAGLMSYRKINAMEQAQVSSLGALAMLRADTRRFVPVPGAELFTERELAFNIVEANPEYQLKRVSYLFKNGRLERTIGDYLEDAAEGGGTRTTTVVLLEGVAAWSFGYTMAAAPEPPPGGAVVPANPDSGKSAAMNDEKYKEPDWPIKITIDGTLADNKVFKASILMPVFNVGQRLTADGE